MLPRRSPAYRDDPGSCSTVPVVAQPRAAVTLDGEIRSAHVLVGDEVHGWQIVTHLTGTVARAGVS